MWRRVIDLLARRPAPPDDERSTKAIQLNGLERDVRETNRRISAIAVEAKRLDSYRRVSHR